MTESDFMIFSELNTKGTSCKKWHLRVYCTSLNHLMHCGISHMQIVMNILTQHWKVSRIKAAHLRIFYAHQINFPLVTDPVDFGLVFRSLPDDSDSPRGRPSLAFPLALTGDKPFFACKVTVEQHSVPGSSQIPLTYKTQIRVPQSSLVIASHPPYSLSPDHFLFFKI